MDINIIKQKIEMIPSLLNEFGIDMWLTFVRETDVMKDPAMDMITDRGVTWQTAFVFTAKGEKYLILGSLDKDNMLASTLYSEEEIKTYVGSIRDELKNTIERISPKSIAINKSADDIMSDVMWYNDFGQKENDKKNRIK